MNYPNTQRVISASAKKIQSQERIRTYIKAIVTGFLMSSQISIKHDIHFIQGDPILAQFSNTLYPDRIMAIPSLEGASEIAPDTLKKMGYNLLHTDIGWVLLDYHNSHLTMLTIQAKVGQALKWQSGVIKDYSSKNPT